MTTATNLSTSFDPHRVMSSNIGVATKHNGQSMRTNNSNENAQPIVGSVVSAEKDKSLKEQQEDSQNLLQSVNQKTEKQSEEDKKELDDKLKEMSEQSAMRKIGIKFVKHEDPECNVVNIIDAESKETIKQIPSEDVLKMSQKLDDFCKEFRGSERGVVSGNSNLEKSSGTGVLVDEKI